MYGQGRGGGGAGVHSTHTPHIRREGDLHCKVHSTAYLVCPPYLHQPHQRYVCKKTTPSFPPPVGGGGTETLPPLRRFYATCSKVYCTQYGEGTGDFVSSEGPRPVAGSPQPRLCASLDPGTGPDRCCDTHSFFSLFLSFSSRDRKNKPARGVRSSMVVLRGGLMARFHITHRLLVYPYDRARASRRDIRCQCASARFSPSCESGRPRWRTGTSFVRARSGAITQSTYMLAPWKVWMVARNESSTSTCFEKETHPSLDATLARL